MSQDGETLVNWFEGPLHALLVRAFPAFVRDPFSDSPRLDVPKLHKALGVSYETLYKWMRVNRLRPKNVKKLIEVAGAPANASALKSLGRNAPALEDFNDFLFA